MSRIGLQPVVLPKGVSAKVDGRTVTVAGPNGQLHWEAPAFLNVEVADNEVRIARTQEDKFAKSMHGTARSLIQNMVQGVHKEFVKELEIQGVGFRAQQQGQKLVMSLGYSHPVEYTAPDGVKIKVTDNTRITVSGASNQLVGQAAAQIRSYYPAEPYKGKGVRYVGEQVRRKAGKTVA